MSDHDPSCPSGVLLASLAGGRLSRRDAASLVEHVGSCERCQLETVAELAQAETSPAVELPARRLGRYVLGDVLGAGAMGVVYAAHDPELDRKIAIKVLRQSTHGYSEAEWRRAQQRLMRESRSLGRIGHPNVVALYDVGELGGEVFVAMELIEGGTLRAWLAQPRELDEILELFESIGRGLQAAHKAGLVHRDFKPENVLIGSDGRPRVTDFGLAMAAGHTSDDGEAPTSAPVDVAGTLTANGEIVGTPGYMAPEQLLGLRVDARADVFAFAVALWEALFGVRPFGGSSLAALTMNIVQQRFLAPRRSDPRREALAAVLRPALTAKPDERMASMDVLLARLREERSPPRSRWRPVALTGAMVALVGLGAFGMWRSFAIDRCRAAADDSFWTGVARSRLVAAEASATSPGAHGLAQQTLRLLDEYVVRLVGARRELCEATLHASAANEASLVAQSECLDRRQHYVTLLAGASPTSEDWEKLIELVTGLDSPSSCRLVSASDTRDPAMRARRKALYAELDGANTELALGHVAVAGQRFEAALGPARQVGDDLAAEALLGLAQTQVYSGRSARAEELAVDAVSWALVARAPELALKGLAVLSHIAAYGYGRVEESTRLVQRFEWLQDASGISSPNYGRLLASHADSLRQRGRFDEALAAIHRGLGRSDLTPAGRVALEHTLGKILNNLGKLTASALVLDRAEIDAVAEYGTYGSVALAIATNRVFTDFAMGGPKAAIPPQRALVARIERFGAEHLELLVNSQSNLEAYLAYAEEAEESLAVGRRAAALCAKLPKDSASRINTLLNHAIRLDEADHLDEARAILLDLQPLVDPEGSETFTVQAAFLNTALGQAYSATDKATARRYLARARRQAAHFPGLPDIQGVLTGIAEVERTLARSKH